MLVWGNFSAYGRAGAVVAALLLCPCGVVAQRGGGGIHGVPIGSPGTPGSRPEGVDEKDSLKDFHHAMEVQASSQQADEFRALVKTTDAANGELQDLVKGLAKGSDAVSGRAAEVKRALEKARVGTKEFVEGLTAKQKSGLKETTGRLEKAATEVGEQEKMLEASAPDAKDEGVRMAGRGESLEKVVANFRRELGSLGEEMGIGLSGDADKVAFKIPLFKTAVNIANQPVSITSATVISRATADSGQNAFKVEATDNLADLEQNLGTILGAQINKNESCGERIAVHDATVRPGDPTSVVMVQMSYERWMCRRVAGSTSPHEIFEGGATVEVNLKPTAGANGELRVESEIGRVEADQFLVEMLRSGDLGTSVREKVTAALTAAIGAASLKAGLPPAVADSAKMESVRFESTRSGDLSAVLSGEMRISDEQATLLGNQLKERVASQALTPGQPQASAPVLQARPQ